MTTIKINCSRIDKKYLFDGKNGKYLDLVLFENKGGPDRYGNTGFVVQDLGKEARDRGEKGEILGNYKEIGTKPAPTASQATKPMNPMTRPPDDDSDAPF